MRTRQRHDRIDDSVVGAYHICAKTVRGGFLTGIDRVALCSYDYREDWVLGRIDALISVFAIECHDRIVLDTALHMILRNRPDVASTWSDDDVAGRWLSLNRSRLELRSDVPPKKLAQLLSDPTKLAAARLSLSSISSFMAHLRQPIAILANREEGERGFFWNPRFGCERLEDTPERWSCDLYMIKSRLRVVSGDDS